MGPALNTRTSRRGGRILKGGVATATALVALTGCAAGEASNHAHRSTTQRQVAAPPTPDVQAKVLEPLQPVAATNGPAPNGSILVKVGEAHGSKQLPTFVPRGRTLYLTFVCLGDGRFTVGAIVDFAPCEGHSGTFALDGQRNVREQLAVSAPAGMRWRLLITSGV